MATYTPFYNGGFLDWPNVTTPVTAAALNYIESGITAASTASAGSNSANFVINADSGSTGTGAILLQTKSTTRLTIQNNGDLYTIGNLMVTETGASYTPQARVHVLYDFLTPPPVSTFQGGFRIELTSKGTGTVSQQTVGVLSQVTDSNSVVNKTVTNAVNNGSGKIRITAASHTFSTNDTIAVYGVVGTTEANGSWVITVIDANTFDLNGSTFTNAYVSGGTATNRPFMSAFTAFVNPSIARGGLTGTASHGDDVGGFAVQNISQVSTAKATDAFYVSATGTITGSAWRTSFATSAACDYAFYFDGTANNAGIDLSPATYGSNPVLRLPNAIPVVSKNGANNADVWMFYLDSSNALQIFPTLKTTDISVGDGNNINLGSTTGTKIGLATSQKLGFYNATPVVQPNTTGTTTGFTAGSGTAASSASTYTGNTGSTAYTVGDIVNALKKVGLMAA